MCFCLCDFETASSANLKKTGAWRYAEDPTTEILCLGWTDGATFRVLAPYELPVEICPEQFIKLVDNPDCIFIAHNVAFEKAVWRNVMMPVYGWPDIPNDRWHDTQSVCAMKGLPLKLERAASALGLKMQKDMEGSRATVALSKPNRAGFFDRSPEKLQRAYDYNRGDLLAELELHRRIRGLGSAERKVWLLDQAINERGIRLDTEFIDRAQSIVDQATEPLTKEFEELTGFRPSQRDKFIAWLHKEGCDIPNLQKDTIAKYLDNEEDEDDSIAGDEEDYAPEELQARLPFQFDRALRIRQILGSASIKKLAAMQGCVCSDGRARGLLQYHGAGPGRWSGRLLQPQNFPRPTLKVDGEPPNQDELVAAILSGDAEWVRCLYGEPISVIASSLRHTLIADPGKIFAVGDFATIEARIVLALAGQLDKVNLIASGQDVYIDMAQTIYRCPVDKKRDPEKRQTGKNSVLGCGFQMGWRKFKARYCPDADDDFAKEVIRTYREDWAPCVPKLWRALEDASTQTAWTGQAHMAYGVVYALEDGWMTARLPSGRKLWYYGPKQLRKHMPWCTCSVCKIEKNLGPEVPSEPDIRPSWEYSAWKMGQWKRISAYGGLLAENVVQALARDLLVNGLFNCEQNGYPTVLTVHDENVTELDKTRADVHEFEQLMTDRPAWAKSLQIPVAAECWIGDRYRK